MSRRVNPRRQPCTQADVDRAERKGRIQGWKTCMEVCLYVLKDKHNAPDDELAQLHREIVSVAEGIAAAKKRGVHFGRKPMERPDSFETVMRDWTDGKLSSRAAANRLQISHTTFLRWVKEPVMQSTIC